MPSNFAQSQTSKCRHSDERPDDTLTNFGCVRAIFGKDDKALLSWRVAILPFIDQDALFKEFKLEESWDSPHNLKLLPRMPTI